MKHLWTMNIFFVLVFLCAVVACVAVTGQSYEDARCKCLCTVIGETQIYKKLYIASVPPNNDCDAVILPPAIDAAVSPKTSNVSNSTNSIVELCPRCTCKYESRNTTIIKVVVIMIVWVMSLLVIYMVFLTCLDPVLNQRIRRSLGLGTGPSLLRSCLQSMQNNGGTSNNYTEHTDEEVCTLLANHHDDYIDDDDDDDEMQAHLMKCQQQSVSYISSSSGCSSQDEYEVFSAVADTATCHRHRKSFPEDWPHNEQQQQQQQQQQQSQEQGGGSGGGIGLGAVNVLSRVSHQQDKWKKQVQEQRRNIYDRHTMLN